MKTKQEIKILTQEPTLYEMYDYLCSKVDWGKSWLDADGVACMNKLFIELKKDKTKYSL